MTCTLATKKLGHDIYMYFRRRSQVLDTINKINGKTWAEAAEELGLTIPSLFVLLGHARKVGLIKEVRIR